MGTLFDVGTKILGSFAAIMLGIFWLGMFTKRATLFSTMLGAVVGVVVMVVLTFVEGTSIGAIWVPTAALLATLLLGVLFGTSKPSEGARQWNWHAIMKRPLLE